MTPPEQIAAKLDATWAGWAVLYGPYSRQFVAFPTVALPVPDEHAGLIIANDHHELERRMALVQRHSWHAHEKPRSRAEHQQAVPPVTAPTTALHEASDCPRAYGRYTPA